MGISSPPRVDHWPVALRAAARLSGTLVACGPGLRPVGWPETPVARCAALGGLLSGRYAAAEDTAAWVWGALRTPGRPLRAITPAGRAPPSFASVSPDYPVRASNFTLLPGDVIDLDGYLVTSPERTLYDLYRSPTEWTREREVATRLLHLLARHARASLPARLAGASRADRARVARRLGGAAAAG